MLAQAHRLEQPVPRAANPAQAALTSAQLLPRKLLARLLHLQRQHCIPASSRIRLSQATVGPPRSLRRIRPCTQLPTRRSPRTHRNHPNRHGPCPPSSHSSNHHHHRGHFHRPTACSTLPATALLQAPASPHLVATQPPNTLAPITVRPAHRQHLTRGPYPTLQSHHLRRASPGRWPPTNEAATEPAQAPALRQERGRAPLLAKAVAAAVVAAVQGQVPPRRGPTAAVASQGEKEGRPAPRLLLRLRTPPGGSCTRTHTRARAAVAASGCSCPALWRPWDASGTHSASSECRLAALDAWSECSTVQMPRLPVSTQPASAWRTCCTAELRPYPAFGYSLLPPHCISRFLRSAVGPTQVRHAFRCTSPLCRCGFCNECIEPDGRGTYSFTKHTDDPLPYHPECARHVNQVGGAGVGMGLWRPRAPLRLTHALHAARTASSRSRPRSLLLAATHVTEFAHHKYLLYRVLRLPHNCPTRTACAPAFVAPRTCSPASASSGPPVHNSLQTVCHVCGLYIQPDAENRISYRFDPFWRERYCAAHSEEEVRRLRCCACSRLPQSGAVPVTGYCCVESSCGSTVRPVPWPTFVVLLAVDR